MESRPARSLEYELVCLAAAALLPVAALLAWTAWVQNLRPLHAFSAITLFAAYYGLLAWRYHDRLLAPYFRLGSALGALRLQDVLQRPRSPYREGIAADVFREFGEIAQRLQETQSRYHSRVVLLHHLIEQLETPVLILDARLRLTQANAASQRFIAMPVAQALGRHVRDLGLEPADGGWRVNGRDRTRWLIRESRFEEEGRRYRLLLLNDIGGELQDAETMAWQRMLRVITHELRNSLTPIRSLAQGLSESDDGSDHRRQMSLKVIEQRSHSLLQFVESFVALARLPVPQRSPVSAASLLDWARTLHPKLHARMASPDIELLVDRQQIEQVLLNLIRNAEESGATADDCIELNIEDDPDCVRISISDRGLGIANPENIFVPLYTTKPGGSGIGLTLSRQILRNHGGDLDLRDRHDGPGAVAELRLPRRQQATSD
jgi:two-component system, NtrC family, nitrogen regulation sensor histidine kinase NtrY